MTAGSINATVFLRRARWDSSWFVGHHRLFLLGFGQSLHRVDHRHNPRADHVLERFGRRSGEPHHRNRLGRLHGDYLLDRWSPHCRHVLLWNQHRPIHNFSAETRRYSKPNHLLQFTILWGHHGRNFPWGIYLSGPNSRHRGHHHIPGFPFLRTTRAFASS